MLKYISFFLLFSIFYITNIKDTVIHEKNQIYLEYSLLLNYNQGNEVEEQIGKMYIDKNQSLFRWGEINTNNEVIDQINLTFHVELGDEVGSYVCKNIEDNKMISKEFIFNQAYFISDEIPDFKWEILKDTKKIEGFECNSAVTKFRGRKYKAWFTQEIPINNGPWKFSGLPGLIIKVQDESKEVSFLLKKLDTKSKFNLRRCFNNNSRMITWEDYKKEWIDKLSRLSKFLISSSNNDIEVNITPHFIEKSILEDEN